MALSTNAWNRLRYSVWALGYDAFTGAFTPLRRRSLERLALQPGEHVLIVGAGTGADLPLLPPGVDVLATDLTPAMLRRAEQRAPEVREARVRFAVMDGQALDLPAESFDAVILHLILAVIPDPARCLAETSRVLRPGGRVAVLDKFLGATARPSWPRRLANLAAGVLFTEINRRFEQILSEAQAPLEVVSDEPAAGGGLFRIIVLRKRTGG